MSDKITGIYKITNKVNGKVYIGCSYDIPKRWREHIYLLNKGLHHSHKLQQDWCKFQPTNFVFEVQETTNMFDVREVEKKWIRFYDSYNTGYNATPVANVSPIVSISPIANVSCNNTDNKERKANKYLQNKNGIVRAIARHDVEYLRNIVGNKSTKYFLHWYDCAEQMFQYDLRLWFDTKKCIMCSRGEKAHIEYDPRHREFQYNCSDWEKNINAGRSHFKHGYIIGYKSTTIFGVVCEIGKFEKREVFDFLIDVFNYDYVMDREKFEMDIIRHGMENVETSEVEYADKLINFTKVDYIKLSGMKK